MKIDKSMLKDREKCVVVKTEFESAVNTLIHNGFEVIGKIGDDVIRPIEYTLWGRLGRIGARQIPALSNVGLSNFKRKGPGYCVYPQDWEERKKFYNFNDCKTANQH